MSAETPDVRQVQGYCGLCIARCGTVATLTDGRFTRLDPDPTHPTGAAICAKGRAAPELVYHKDRLTRPLRRTRPKGDADPGWEEISWNAALDQIAAAMRCIAEQHGPEAVAFSQPSSSTTAIVDSTAYIRRLMNAFGTPNLVYAFDLCGWGRAIATRYVFGVGTVGIASSGAMPDIAESGCLILWGYNPSFSRITHATATVAGLKRGMKLIVIDPRNVGLANKADVWLRVRPGTDGALALGLANVMIERGWYDQEFVRAWSNGPLLVRSDTDRLLRANELASGGSPDQFVAWDSSANRTVSYDPAAGRYETTAGPFALRGEFTVATIHGAIGCRPVFDHYAELCKTYSPEVIERTCWIPASQLEQAARIIGHARPVSYYAWSGHEHHANSTETARAMAMLYALTGSFDAPGGNVLLPAVPAGSITGEDLPAAKRLVPAIGLVERPLGPARLNNVSARDFYDAVLEGTPYPVRGLIGFGNNLLLAQGDPVRGRAALAALDFYAHADLFMTPTAALADIVLPVASCFEREALKIGFEISADAQSHVQLRQAIVEPQGEARSDTDIIFGLATRLGFGEQFWDGNVDASYRQQLGPSGFTVEQLRAQPAGLRKPLTMRYRKHAGSESKGNPCGFPTPSRKIEFWSETFLDRGYSAMPDFVEPPIGPVARPDLAAAFPLILTCAKPSLFCQTQHRALPSLRKRALHPEIELNPATAAARGIKNGDWVDLRTPAGAMRARARFSDQLDPRVVVGEHGWWQGCDELGIAGSDPFAANGTNFNLTVDAAVRDPVSGTPAHRSNLCEVRLVAEEPVGRAIQLSGKS
ncbi:molybdopterin-dependent oxidoreductase [Bradyrhizobium sp. CCBAU 53421]|uniref:molybdopterin-containing oxidoreductase family protein n=1 Tax=Bradyrhizobium sp. CCBAU 53421 TaxID=1325120 RepID=UPI00188C8B4F|nr:molybdopterin-dependent oxidoreductase [Bradyrhizobium sp. CCBAU 53421]QOZ37756.1 molybdopterin oxidoreductase [Bradyrhizobium sp. CCBAU 53421]